MPNVKLCQLNYKCGHVWTLEGPDGSVKEIKAEQARAAVRICPDCERKKKMEEATHE